jgi:hypothetical protein
MVQEIVHVTDTIESDCGGGVGSSSRLCPYGHAVAAQTLSADRVELEYRNNSTARSRASCRSRLRTRISRGSAELSPPSAARSSSDAYKRMHRRRKSPQCVSICALCLRPRGRQLSNFGISVRLWAENLTITGEVVGNLSIYSSIPRIPCWKKEVSDLGTRRRRRGCPLYKCSKVAL